MEQLKNYITLLRVANQTLEKLHNNNHVAYFDMDNNIIFLDGDKLNDFCTSHTFDICVTTLLSLRTRYKANHIHLVYRNAPIARFTWNDDAKMYLDGKNGGYYQTDKQL